MKRTREIEPTSLLKNLNLSVIPPFFQQAMEVMGKTSVPLTTPNSLNHSTQAFNKSDILNFESSEDKSLEESEKPRKTFKAQSYKISILYANCSLPNSPVDDLVKDTNSQKKIEQSDDLLLIPIEDLSSCHQDQEPQLKLWNEVHKIEIQTWDQFKYFLENYPTIRLANSENLKLLDFSFDFDGLLKIKQNSSIINDDFESLESNFLDDADVNDEAKSTKILKTPNTLLFSYLLLITMIELMIKASNGNEENDKSCFSSNLHISHSIRKNFRSQKNPSSNEIYDCIKDEFSKILKKFQQFDKKKFNIHNFMKPIVDIEEEFKTGDLLKSYCHDFNKSFQVIINKIDNLKQELRKPRSELSAGKRQKVLLIDKINYLQELCECGMEKYQKLVEKGLIAKLPVDTKEGSQSIFDDSKPSSNASIERFYSLKNIPRSCFEMS